MTDKDLLYGRKIAEFCQQTGLLLPESLPALPQA
jgi:hypothetical protein